MKPRVAVHKFSSCDGCQLAFLNAGEKLVELAQYVEFVHFAEAGYLNEDAEVDIAFVEGSVTTPHEQERIRRVRERSRFLVAFGACANAGGIQALRNAADAGQWMAAIYPNPEYIDTLATSTPMAEHVRIDCEIPGCPPNTRQVMGVVRSLLSGAVPYVEQEKICLECKRQHHVCVLVAKGMPCMGPLTRTGCGALCPSVGRDCYQCYGPAENVNGDSLSRRFETLGLDASQIAKRFLYFYSATDELSETGQRWQEKENG